MSVKIDIPSYLQPYTGGVQVVEAEGCAVGACLQYLVENSPEIQKMLFGKDGKLLAYVCIYINGEDAHPHEITRTVHEGDTIYISYVIGGG